MLDFITQRAFVVSLAVVGALTVTVANWMLQSGKLEAERGRIFVKAGYLITGLSILLFVVAGFRSG